MPPDREERFLGEHDSVRRSPRTVNAFNYFQNLDFLSKTLGLYDFSKLDRGLKFHRDVWGYFRTISFHPDRMVLQHYTYLISIFTETDEHLPALQIGLGSFVC